MNNKIGKQIDGLVGVFTDPLVVCPGGWHDTLPDWIKSEVTLQRLIMEMQVSKGAEASATDAEACAYLYTASLEAPMDRDWADIYLHVCTKLLEKKGTPAPEDIRMESITQYQQGQLNDLKRWIYRRRTQAREESGRQRRREAKAIIEAAAPKQLALTL